MQILPLSCVNLIWTYTNRLCYSNSHILWTPKVHHSVHSSLPLTCSLHQMIASHTVLSYFSKIHFSIIFQPTPVSQPFKLLEYSVHTSHPSHLVTIKHHSSRFNNSTIFNKYKFCSSSLCSLRPPPHYLEIWRKKTGNDTIQSNIHVH
jgi:hypothetical protein